MILPFRVYPLLIATLIAVSFFPAVAGDIKTVISSDTIFSSDVEIPEGTVWNIEPGTRLLFEGYRTFCVRGLVIAEGTMEKPIVFSTLDRPTGSQDRPGWKGIEIIGPKANGQFRHCRIEGAYRNLVWGSNPSFDSCEIAGNHYGLYCAKKAAPHIDHCHIHRNVYGVAADFAYPLLLDNVITENVIGLYLQLCSDAIAGKNLISGNTTNIRLENAFGKNTGSVSLQGLWEIMQQVY